MGKYTYKNWHGEGKKRMRTLAMEHGMQDGPAESALLFPAKLCLDVEAGLDLGFLIPRNTRLVVVDKDFATAQLLVGKLSNRYGFPQKNVHVHFGLVHKLDLRGVLRGWGLSKLNLGWVDSCYQLNAYETMWIREQLSPLCKRMAFTFLNQFRLENWFLRELLDGITREDKVAELASDLMNKKFKKGADSNFFDGERELQITMDALALAVVGDKSTFDRVEQYRDKACKMMLALVTQRGKDDHHKAIFDYVVKLGKNQMAKGTKDGYGPISIHHIGNRKLTGREIGLLAKETKRLRNLNPSKEL